ncbi:MAG: TAXI family TRAP transporter solute-binding subunit [Pseudobacteriovorax sp.]|nr:TAXI family TRAP transporter solute-binding subunit [Pseudobacteriovorax sp.]
MSRFLVVLLCVVSLAVGQIAWGKDFYRFTGGPTGGTFQLFSSSLSVFLSDQLKDMKVSNQASAGSTENLRRIEAGRAHFGVVHSGDLFLGREGRLLGDKKRYSHVFALAVLYQSAAQLVVMEGSGIKSVEDLAGKRIGIGGPGSGAAATAERFFKAIGSWDKIDRKFLGYSKAASAMRNGQLDAMWVVSGYPTRAVIELAAVKKIRLLDLHGPAEKAGFYKLYPFYQKKDIPSGTYASVKSTVSTFVDSTIWVAGKKASPKRVQQALESVYSEAGLRQLKTIVNAASYMSLENGIQGIKVPLHPGAQAFWNKKQK